VPKPSAVSGPEISSRESEPAEREPGLSGASLEVVPAKKRRRKKYSASEKLRIVKAAEAAVASGERGALEALMRREGIYSSHLSAWRQQLAARGSAGLASQKPGRKPKLDEKDRQLLAVTKENAALKRKLLIANALIELQKKAHAVLGLALPELDEES
jgi:transposase-like protein